MTQLRASEIGGFIYLVGGFGPGGTDKAKIVAWLDTAIAVCLAESGGDTNAKNGSSSASGLWQIMVSVHKDLIAKYSDQYKDGTKLPTVFDPMVNTSIARDLYKERGWQPWEAYNTGAYKKHLGYGEGAYNWMKQKGNLETLKANYLKYRGSYQIDFNIDATGLGAANGEYGSVLPNKGDIMGNISSLWSGTINALKDAGIATGIFILGALLLILGALALFGRSNVARKVPGPVGLVASAASGK